MIKKIFIEIPTWLGDAIMATPAIENIIKSYPEAKITLLFYLACEPTFSYL